eukprot:Pgem_evm1s11727
MGLMLINKCCHEKEADVGIPPKILIGQFYVEQIQKNVVLKPHIKPKKVGFLLFVSEVGKARTVEKRKKLRRNVVAMSRTWQKQKLLAYNCLTPTLLLIIHIFVFAMFDV